MKHQLRIEENDRKLDEICRKLLIKYANPKTMDKGAYDLANKTPKLLAFNLKLQAMVTAKDKEIAMKEAAGRQLIDRNRRLVNEMNALKRGRQDEYFN